MAQRNEINRLEAQVTKLEADRASLEQELERIHDPDYVEQLARCMGMVRPGEIAFVNPNAPKPKSC